jgi:hypothetical protein
MDSVIQQELDRINRTGETSESPVSPVNIPTISELADVPPSLVRQNASDDLERDFPPPIAPVLSRQDAVVATGVNDVNAHLSATSPPMSEPAPFQAPTTVQRMAYHLVFDTEFSLSHLTSMNSGTSTGTFGRHINTSTRIPVLFDLPTAEKVATKLIKTYTDFGSVGEKKFPVFGVVIMYLDTSKIEQEEVSNFVNMPDGHLDYSKLNSAIGSKPLIIYNNSGSMRGLLNRSELNSNMMVNAKYIDQLNIQDEVGFAMLNLSQHLSGNDVRQLKTMKKNTTRTLTNLPQDNALPDASFNALPSELVSGEHVGGDYKKLYKQTKKEYLELKKRRKI